MELDFNKIIRLKKIRIEKSELSLSGVSLRFDKDDENA